MLLKLFQEVENFLKRLELRLDALTLAVSTDLQTKSKRNLVECVKTLFVAELLKVLEESVLRRDFMVVLEMVYHLPKVVRQAIEVDRTGYGTPTEVIVGLLIVGHFRPVVGSCLLHHPSHEL